MTKAERLSNKCQLCVAANGENACGYIPRGLQSICQKISDIEDGYEYAIEDAIDWLKKNINRYIIDFGTGNGKHEFVVKNTCWTDLEKEITGE